MGSEEESFSTSSSSSELGEGAPKRRAKRRCTQIGIDRVFARMIKTNDVFWSWGRDMSHDSGRNGCSRRRGSCTVAL